MKINNLTKIIIIIVALLSISLAIKAASLGYIKKNTNTNPPISEVEPVNEELEKPTVEIPIEVKDIPSVEDTPTTKDIPTTEPIFKDIEPSEDKPIPKENNTADDDDDKTKADKSNNDSDKKPNKNSDKKPNKNSNNNSNNSSNNSSNKNSNNSDNKNSNNSSNKNSNGANNSKNNQSIVASKIISKDKAIEIGLKKIGSKSKLITVDSVLDDNPPKYILTISKNKSKYYIEIHAKTGAILDYEKE